MGNGRYIPIPQDGGQLVIIETPFDIEIIELQGRINGTVIPYGPKMQRSSVEQKTRQVATAPVPTASEMAGYMARNAKRSGGTDGQKLRDALAATKDFVGITGKTTLDAKRNATKPAVIIEVKDGKFVYKETVNP